MHAALDRIREDGGATLHDAVPFPSPSPGWQPNGRYGEGPGRRPSLAAIAIVAAFHVLLLGALIKLDVIPLAKKRSTDLVVVNILEPPPPPPPAAPAAEPQPEKPVAPPIVAPPPVVRVADPPPVKIAVVEQAPPPQAVIVSEAPPRPAVATGSVSVADLSTSVTSSVRPRVPLESRRKREAGTVFIRVTLGLDGRVEQASVSRSCGFPRLDEAALEAVRRWRWSPKTVSGEPVRVSGIVPIDFVAPPA